MGLLVCDWATPVNAITRAPAGSRQKKKRWAGLKRKKKKGGKCSLHESKIMGVRAKLKNKGCRSLAELGRWAGITQATKADRQRSTTDWPGYTRTN